MITIWECELTPRRRAATLEKLDATLKALARAPYQRTDLDDLNIAAEPQY
ncbi:MAG: hypothetical protein LIP09_15905 [Bacteroidales bacterium]|nr:hypothetical protein [Bacteroidales bacterium]